MRIRSTYSIIIYCEYPSLTRDEGHGSLDQKEEKYQWAKYEILYIIRPNIEEEAKKRFGSTL